MTKKLPEGSFLVDKNSVKLENRHQFPDRVSLEDQLSALIKQKPNRRAWFFTRYRAWVYSKRGCESSIPYQNWQSKLAKLACEKRASKQKKETKLSRWICKKGQPKVSKITRWVCEKYGEPLSVFNDSLTLRSEENMKNYMQQRGFFRVQVFHDTRLKGKKVRTTYTVVAGERFKIDSFSLVCFDPAIDSLLKNHDSERILRPGLPLDVQLFDQEKARITRLLRNSGYADFTAQAIKSTGDSTGAKTSVAMRVGSKSDGSRHQTWRIGQIEVYSDFKKKAAIDTVFGQNVHFLSSEPALSVRPDVILNAIHFHTGDLFCEDSVNLTNRKLVGLGVYRFVNIRTEPDTARVGELRTRIILSKNKRMSAGGDLDLNGATGATVGGISNNLIGFALSGNLKARNLALGGEQLSLTAQLSTELDPSGKRLFFSRDARWQLAFSAPRFIDYLGFWKTARRTGLVSKPFYTRLKNSGQPRGSLGYEFRDIFDYFRIHSFAGSYGFDIRPNLQNRFIWQHLGVDLLASTFYPAFDDATKDQIRLRNSLGSRLITGFVLKEFNWQKSSLPNQKGQRLGSRLSAEISGGEVYLANKLANTIKSKTSIWKLGEVDFSQFVRLDAELSWSKQLDRSVSASGRIAAGGIKNFGFSSSSPYLKQFFVGGPNSLRGWQILELGPGGFHDAAAKRPFFQKGDFRLEASAELRFPIWWAYRGTLFFDAGNQWLWREDSQRPNSGLSKNAFQQIALNTGLGVRLDLDYFLIRVDFGLPLRNPYSSEDNPNYWIYQNLKEFKLSDWRPNLAIGLPF